MSNYFTEAFKSLKSLTEDTFNINDADDMDALTDIVSAEDADDTISVFDMDAEDQDAVDTEVEETNYIGQVILDCCVCHSKIYKDKGDIVLDEEGTVANVDQECPICSSTEGFKIVGEVAPYNASEDSVDVTAEDDGETVDADVTVETTGTDEDADEIAEDDLTESISDYDKIMKALNADITEAKNDSTDTKQLRGFRKRHKDMTEDFEKVDIDTGDQIIHVSADDKDGAEGTGDITTDETVIAPLSDTTAADIEQSSADAAEDGEEEDDGYADIDVGDISDETEGVIESYLKESYSNIQSYQMTKSTTVGNRIKLEGVITFNSGKTKKTDFLFEAKDATKTGKVRFIGENKQITRGHKSFMLSGKMDGTKFITESLNYNYRAKMPDGSSKKVCGRSKVGK